MLRGAQTSEISPALDLVLFEHTADGARRYMDAGIRHVIVDAEILGKHRRQLSADTEIKPVPLTKIGQLARIDGLTVYCRINPWGTHSHDEIKIAIDQGATRIFLPMVTTKIEIESFIDAIANRCEAAILIETQDAVAVAGDLRKTSVSAVYVGLNDLAISRGAQFIFTAVADGTVGAIRRAFPGIDFGFAGLTVLGRGSPIPCRMLLTEMASLRCSFSFLRRSFRRDIEGRDPNREIKRIKDYWHMLATRDPTRIARDRTRLKQRIAQYE